MPHVKGLHLLHCLGINLIFYYFLISEVTTPISKNHMKTDTNMKKKYNKNKVLKILFTALKVYLHFRQLC